MSSILVINAAGPETRVALVENGTISEFYLERKKDKGIVGNIYKGKVVRVLPGMQAAFVDIGLEKAAFLYVADVAGGPDFSEEFDISETPEGEHGEPPGGEIPPEDAADALRDPTVAALADTDIAEPFADEAEGDAAAEEPELSGDESTDAESTDDAAPAGVTAEDAPVEGAGAEAIAEGAPSPESLASELPSAEALPASEVAAPVAKEKATRGPAPQKGQIRNKAIEPLARKRRRVDAPVRAKEPSRNNKTAQIQDLLKEGQEVIVQVVKDPIGTKGARVTCHISLPGRHLVFMPTVDHVGISRRVENERERRRLRELVDGLRPPGTGFIVRTVADGVDRDKLVADIKFLLGLWNEMAHKKDRLRAPALLHPDLDLILRSIRDLFSAEVEKLVIDDRAEYERIVQFVGQSVPHLKSAIEFYDGNDPIFDAYGIEQELTRALSRKVWLKSGGYLIVDQAEALVAVDVNSGRFVGKKNLEETITAINIEAAKEIVYQLRLRNIGGIIIIDFIDMEKMQNRQKVFSALQDALQKDRAKTNIVKISELGLVEMTRKRVRESVGRLLHEPCVQCDGRGYLKSKTTIAYEIFREIQREGTARREDTLVVSCNPEVAKYIQGDEREALRHLMMRFNKTIQIKPVGSHHQEQYEVTARWSRKEDAVAKEDAPAREQQPRRESQQRREDQPRREKQAQKPAPEAPAAPVIPPPAPQLAANAAAADEGDDEEDDEETPGAPAAGAQPGVAGQPGQPASSRRRRRRRRGRGGSQGAAPGAAPAAGAGRPPGDGGAA